MGEQGRRELTPLLLVEAHYSPPLLTDSTNDPELLSVMVKRPPSASPCTPHLSQLCLAVSQPPQFVTAFGFCCAAVCCS